MELYEGAIAVTKKKHPCGSDSWKLIRVGADVKLECLGCGKLVMLARREAEKRIKSLREP